MSKPGVIAILYSQTAADLIPRLLQVHFFWQWACFYWQQQPFSTIRKGQQKVTVNSAFPHCLSLVSRPICSGCVGLNEQRANLAMDNWMVKRLTLNLHEHLCNLGLNPGRTAFYPGVWLLAGVWSSNPTSHIWYDQTHAVQGFNFHHCIYPEWKHDELHQHKVVTVWCYHRPGFKDCHCKANGTFIGLQPLFTFKSV